MTLHMVTYICVHVCNRKPSLNPNPKHTGTRSAVVWPPSGKCYRPTVFFHHLSLTALSLPQRKIRRALQTCCYLSVFTFKKPRSLKLRWNCVSAGSLNNNLFPRQTLLQCERRGGSQGRGAHRLPSVTACCCLLVEGKVLLISDDTRNVAIHYLEPNPTHGMALALQPYVQHTLT